MKATYTIHNFAKRLVMVLAVGFMVVNAWGAKYSMTPNQASTGSSATTYIETLTGFTYANPTGSKIKWKMNYWNPKTLQIKSNQSNAANEFRFYTDSVLPGKITKVVVTFSALTVSDATKLMFKGGTSAQTGTSSGTAGTWNGSAKTLTWTPGSSDNYTYFAFYQNGKAASGTNYLASSDAIVVTYLTKVTLDKNSGTADGVAYFDDNATAASTATGYTFSAPTHATKTCTGYYTDSSGGTKVLDADGTFAAATVSGYITSNKWTYAGGTLKLYAQWEASCTSQGVIVEDEDESDEGTYNYGISPIGLEVLSEGTGAVTWSSSNTSVATVTGDRDGATVTIAGAGSATITASVAADATYCAGSGEYALTVNSVAPTLSHNTSGKELTVSSFTSTGATFSGGVVTNKGGADITRYGFLIGTSSTVVVSGTGDNTPVAGSIWNEDIDANTAFGSKTATSSFSPNTTYYVRVFATNDGGTTYGYSDAKSFTTLQSYAISYNNNGGSGSMASTTKDHGVNFTLPANAGSMTKTGYHITGWLLGSSSGTHFDVSGTYEGNAAATFYVEWTANTYQVAFNANGGTGSMSNEDFTYGASAKALTTCTFTPPTHKYFYGWADTKAEADAGTRDYAPGASVSNLTTTNGGTVTLYAVWLDHTFTNYRTRCCTDLDAINGEVEWNDPTEAVLTWDDIEHVSSWAVQYKTHDDDDYTDFDGSITGTGTKTCTITGLSCGTDYDFLISATAATGYCNKEQLIEDDQVHKYSLSKSGEGNGNTFTVEISSSTVTKACDGATIDLTATVADGYSFEGWTITKAGSGTVDPDDAADESTSFEMPEDDVTITADFECVTPTISVHPASASYVQDASATALSVTASAADASLSYQWEYYDEENKEWVEIDDEDKSTFTPSTADVGATKYHVVVTNAASGCSTTATSNTATITVSAASVCLAPTFSVSEGTYTTSKSVEISTETTDATIYYTTNGSEPTTSSSVYSSAITVATTTTIKAIAVKAEMTNSSVSSATYTIQCATPTFSVDAGTYVGTKSVGISTTYGTTIYYTLDGSTPTTSSNAYSSALSVDTTTTIKALAVKDGCSNSAVASATYTIKCATPTFSPSAGTYNADQSVELSTTYGSTIYYTTDGSTPTTISSVYSKAISVTATTTIKAFAVKTNCSNSDVSSATFTMKCATPTFSVDAGTHSGAQEVEIECTTDDVTIYYTTDGSTPTDESDEYEEAITVSESATLKAIAVRDGWSNSNVASAAYTITYTVTWSVNGEEWESGVVAGNSEVEYGSKVSAMATAPTKADCDDLKKFRGWTLEAIDGSTDDEPDMFTDVAGSPYITQATTFYAVFATESGGDYTRVTNVASQISTGKKVIMGYEATANSGVIIPIQSASFGSNILYPGTTLGSAGTGTIDMSELTYEGSANYAFTIHAGYTSGYFAFEQAGDEAGKYIGHNGKNSVAQYSTIEDTKVDFSITLGDNDVASIVNKYGNDNTTKDGSNYYYFKYLRYNSANDRVAIYRTGQADMVLYLCNPLVYSNYVTTCASCDADATFTNTTPVVSEIGCTSATLTATGGLATIGATGCNIREYGFVIGTSDNLAIGGSGVTKLQVGTSNPTIGADFSYDATGLTKGTHYYLRAYATNKHGTAYSSSEDFWTQGVSSIAVTTAPRVNYIVGETFDPTGMVVTATMASSDTEDVTADCEFSPDAETALTADDDKVTITYTLCGDEETTTQEINVWTLTVTEGTNADKGVASYTTGATFSIGSLTTHWTAGFAVTNGEVVSNGDGSYTVIPDGKGDVTVTVNYREAAQKDVTYKVNGVTITSLSDKVYESETAELPTGSKLATAISSQGVKGFENYPNFVGWIATPFYGQATEPAVLTSNPTITADITYHAVFTNLDSTRIDEGVLTTTSYKTSETNLSVDGFTDGFVHINILKTTTKLQFKKDGDGYLYNKTPLPYIQRIEVGATADAATPDVFACYAPKKKSSSALTDEDTADDRYIYLFPDTTNYFLIKSDNYTDYVDYIDIYYTTGGKLGYVCQTRDYTTEGNWNTTANWSGSAVPTIHDVVRIQKPVTVNVTNAKVADVILDKSSSNTGKITVSAGKALVIDKDIRVWNGSAYSATTASDLIIESDKTNGTGALIVGGESEDTKATVHFYSKARKNSADKYVNQYFGIPFAETTKYSYYGSYLRVFDVATDKWVSLSSETMSPWTAYRIMREEKDDGETYVMDGTLNLPGNGGTETLTLTRSGGEDTDNMFANSWTAPISVKAMETSDFVGAKATVYIFKAGSKTDHDTNGGSVGTASVLDGQWLSLPITAVKANPSNYAMTVIPSQQAFLVQTDGSGGTYTLTLDYTKHVYTPALTAVDVQPTLAPRRVTAEETPEEEDPEEETPEENDALEIMTLNLTGESGFGDRVLMYVRGDFSDGYDNGWEGYKLSGSAFAPQLCAFTEIGEMAITATDDPEGTVLGFYSGSEDSYYTFRFGYEGEQVWYLNDLDAQLSTQISEGNLYEFYATPSTLAEHRFVISKTPIRNIATGIEGAGEETKARKLIIEDHLYIIRQGHIFGADGCLVK